MSKNKIVSVIMPNWNTPKDYLERSISSVVGQKEIELSDIELVIVDDFSNTTSAEDLKEAVKAQKETGLKISINNNRYDKGAANARNTGVQLSNAQYIAFLDSDDALTENAIEKSIQRFSESTDFCMVFSDFIKKDKNMNNTIHKRRRSTVYGLHKKHKNSLQDPILHGSFGEHFSVYRHGVIESVNGFRNVTYVDVYDLQLRISALSENVNIGHTPEFLYVYRDNTAGLTYINNKSDDNDGKEGITESILLDNIKKKYPQVTKVVYVPNIEDPHGPCFFDVYVDDAVVKVPWFDRSTLSIKS
jgi:glycosyltransferase involved in cell wall biosynthesis